MPPPPATPTRPSAPTPSPVAHPVQNHDPSPSNTRDNTATRFNKWAVKNSIAVTGWLVAFASMIVAIVSLLPGFRGQRLSEKALELAEWTALKDYIEQCKQILEAGVVSSECEQASTMSLPPPPHVKTHSIDHIKRLITLETNSTSVESLDFGESSDLTPVMIMLAVFLTLLLIAVFLFASFESRKSLYLQNRVYWQDSESVAFTMDLVLQERLESSLEAPTTIDTEPSRPIIEFDSPQIDIFQSLFIIRSFNGWSAEEIRLADYNKGFRYGIQQDNTALPAAQPNESQAPQSNKTSKSKNGFPLNRKAKSTGFDSLHAENLFQRKQPRTASDTQPPDDTSQVGKVEDAPEENEERRAFACPYYKQNPIKYLNCIHQEQKTPRYVRTHLLRKHKQPPYCPCCFEHFGTHKDRDVHVNNRGCEQAGFQAKNPFIDLIDGDKAAYLDSVPRSIPETEQWKHMYSIVFPDHPPPSPFRDGRAEAKLVLESYRGQMVIDETGKMDADIAAGRTRGKSRHLTEIDIENILAEMLR